MILLTGRTFDEASFGVLKEINAERPASERVSLARSKEVLREQFLIMMLHEETTPFSMASTVARFTE